MKTPFPSSQIPAERKQLYYAGMALTVVGLLLFLSVFVSMLLTMAGIFRAIEAGPGPSDSFAGFSRVPWIFLRGFAGFVMMLSGGGMMSVAARGLAGSGVVLDPEQARRDLEPWNRMKGGMVSDALGEVEVVQRVAERLGVPSPAGGEVVKVRCPACRNLNDEQDKFCGQCGGKL